MQESDLPRRVSDSHKYKLLATTIMEQAQTKHALENIRSENDTNPTQNSQKDSRGFRFYNTRILAFGGISLMILGILGVGILFLSNSLNQSRATDTELISSALQKAQELNLDSPNKGPILPLTLTTPQIDDSDMINPQADTQTIGFSVILKIVEETNPVRITGKAPVNAKIVNDRYATISAEGSTGAFSLRLNAPLEIQGPTGYSQIQPISNINVPGLFRFVAIPFPDDKIYTNLYKYATEYPDGLRICRADEDLGAGNIGQIAPNLVGSRCGLGAVSLLEYDGNFPIDIRCEGAVTQCDKIMSTVKVEVLPYIYQGDNPENKPIISPISNPVTNPIDHSKNGITPQPGPKKYQILTSNAKYNPQDYIYKDSGLANCGLVDIDGNGTVDADEMQLLFALESKKCDMRSYLPEEVTTTCGIRDVNFSGSIDVNDLDTAMARLDNKDKCIYFSVIDRQLQPLFCPSIDINNNGLYDIAEFSRIRDAFGRACQNVAPRGTCITADINNDGIVNITDFTIFAANIGKSCAVALPDLVCGALDVNADDKINYVDYYHLSKNFGRNCQESISTDSLFGLLDVNKDKLINITDFSNLAKYYGREIVLEPDGIN